MFRILTTAFVFFAATSAPAEQLWSLQPPSGQTPPTVSDTGWPLKPLDHFILSRIEAAGQHPTEGASRQTLVRRAYLDLHGLPPTTEQIHAFVADDRTDAWERLIDALLASPRYGERWGRHWLDIARYSDSNGMDENIAHPHAHRYRDYVIAAFNDDKPFDEFVIEQLAGDLLPARDLEQTRGQTIAAGFLSVGPKMLACDDPDKMRRDIVDEQIDTTGRAFLGLTLGCARCHDHKFDPVSIEDYYGLAGIFMSTKTLTKYSVVAEFHQHDLSPLLDKAKREQIAALEKRKTPITSKEIDRLRKDLPPRFEVMAVTEYPTEDSQRPPARRLPDAWRQRPAPAPARPGWQRPARNAHRSERPARTRALDRFAWESVHGTRDCQPHLALALRPRHRRHHRQLRHPRRRPLPPCPTRPPRAEADREPLVDQGAPPRDHEVRDLPAIIPRQARAETGRSGEPPVRPLAPTPRRVRGDPRFDSVQIRSPRPHLARPGTSSCARTSTSMAPS